MSEPASTTFLGREAELAEGERLLAGCRMLTVTGPGGAGKTRFAAELTRRAGRGYERAPVACLFAPLRDPALVLPTIAQALGVREAGDRGALDLIADRVGESEALLFLDNLEHLLAASPDISELVRLCPRLTVLCTSRERLRVEPELAYELPPLGEDESVALFCERAGVEPSGAIRELCRRLEGLPLALELAAARLAILSPDQLLERLARRLDLLKSARETDPRQQTLRATIQWSYDLLTPAERTALERLSAFVGGCTSAAAEEVCGADRPTLESLVDKSLLRYLEGRYAMLETIREFGEERLEQGGAADEIRRRHAQCFVALTAPAADEFEGGVDPLPALGPEHANIRHALAFLERTDRSELGLRLVASSWPLWYSSGTSREGRRWADAFLERTRGEHSAPRAKALLAASVFACWTGELDDAEEYAAESLPMLRALGEERSVPALLTNLGLVAMQRGDPEAARARFEEAARVAQGCGNPFQRAGALVNLCELDMLDGDFELAARRGREAGAIFDALGSDWGRGWALINQAYCSYFLERDEEALRAIRAVLETLRDSFDAALVPTATVLVAGLAGRGGAYEHAAVLVQGAEAVMRSSERQPTPGIEVDVGRAAMDAAAQALGPTLLAAALARGRGMSVLDLRRYSLEVAQELSSRFAVAG